MLILGTGSVAPYHADAVHFDGSTWLINAALTATDNGLFSFSYWIKAASAQILFVSDPVGDYFNYLQLNVGSPDVQFMDVEFSDGTNGLSDVTSSYDGTIWLSIVASFNLNTQIGKVYVTDADKTGAITPTGAGFMPAFNGLLFVVADDTFGDTFVGDLADLRIMPGVSLLDGGGDIPEATRRLFIDAGGKPVDPAVATAALGAPRILFSGNAAAFATNQGTGGAFILTGALTNASTSPSDPYVGPLDLVAGAMAAFSQRAMSAAMLGEALYTIRRNNDDATQSFSSDANSGRAPVASINAFIGGPGVTGFGSLWNDQSGNARNVVQATSVDQPTWTATADGSIPGFIANLANISMFGSAFAFAGGALYAAVVCNITIATGPVLFTLDTDAGGHPNVLILGTFYNAPGDISLVVGASDAEWASTTTLADGLHLIEMWIDGAGNVTMFADGADAGATLQAGVDTAIAPEAAMVVEYPSRSLGGITQLEVAIWDTIPSAPNRLAIRQNMAAFYGITLA